MGWNTRASDWKVAGQAQVGGGHIAAAGIWWFTFQSETAQWSGTFAFVGLGYGAGGSIGGASLPNLSTGRLNWTQLECLRPFSAADLHSSAGTLYGGGAGLAWGYGVVIISADNLSGNMFDNQYCYGGTAGVGASILATSGRWWHMSTGVMQR